MNNIDLLSRIFTPVFDKKLENLERNAKNQLNLINVSLNLTSQVVHSCKTIREKTKVYLENKKKTTGALNISETKKTNGNISRTQCKTPIRCPLTSSRSVSKFTSTPYQNDEISKCHSIGNLLHKSKSKDKVSIRSKSVRVLIPNMKKNGNNGQYSTLNLKSTNNITSLNRPILPLKNSGNSIKLNKQPAKAKNLKMYNAKQSTQGVSKTIDDESFDRIFSIDDIMVFNKEDPLLISPFGDKDLLEVNDNIEDYTYSTKYKVKKFNVKEWCEDHLVIMIKYLTKTDIFRLLFVNKSFAHIINQYLFAYLEDEKNKYQSLFESIENPITSYDSSPFKTQIQFTKKTFKAISLLNESVINKLFTDAKVPSNDILLIYAIYFQLINHPLAIEVDMKKIFWKKCCQYFIVQSNGKTGDLLQRTMSDNLVITSENMYKLMQLVDGNLNKMTPSYFSKICGTTGLIVFFIQDVLEHLGISTDKTKRSKGYLIYSGIIETIEKKIEHFKQYIH